MKAVRFAEYGGVDVLEVREVEDPVAGPGRVVVAVKAAGINPGEIAIREGRLHDRWPATFPSGEGTDFAGVVQAAHAAGITTIYLAGPQKAVADTDQSQLPDEYLTASIDAVHALSNLLSRLRA